LSSRHGGGCATESKGSRAGQRGLYLNATGTMDNAGYMPVSNVSMD